MHGPGLFFVLLYPSVFTYLYPFDSRRTLSNMKIELATLNLGEITTEQFLAQYWQKQPLLIRNALPGFTGPISPDELAGLACDEDIESRLVIEKGGVTPWEVQHGPFTPEDFTSMPESHWTLLVQDAEKHVQDLYELIQPFRFIPDWRIDDLMISYATDHGSVGPHKDDYDVFLLQGLGRRRWQISTQPVSEDNVIDNLELCIMKEFQAEQEWVLEPGDLLYLPPNVAHYGTAVGECMTYSIGFRAPRNYELLHGFLEHKLEKLLETGIARQTYRDPDLAMQDDPAHISTENIEKLRTTIQDLLPKSPDEVDHWIGKYLSKSKEHLAIQTENQRLSRAEFIALWQESQLLMRNIAVRILYTEEDDQCVIYAYGCRYPVPAKYREGISTLCRKREISFVSMSKWLDDELFANLICQFYNLGYLYFE